MPKKVLFLTLKTFSFTGGIEKASRSLIKAIGNARFQLTTWSMYDGTKNIDNRYTANTTFKGFNGKRLSFAFNLLASAFKFDTVILSHINLLLFGKIIKNLKPSTKIILWAHGIEIWRTIPKWKKTFLQQHTDIWAVSTYTKQQIITRHQINATRISVLNNTLDPFFHLPIVFEKPIDLIERYQIKPDSYVLFSLTRLSATEHKKNYDTVISAVSHLKTQFPNLVYLIGGKADEQEHLRLQQHIDQHQLGAYVKLTGFIEEQEITAHFSLADTFVLPSEKEGFGIVFIQAAACGCQVIAGNTDGSTDALLHGKLGQLVNPKSEKEITHAIQKAIENKNHQPLAQQALTVENFGFDGYVRKVRELLVG